MKSVKRKLLKKHLNETCEFMAVVQKVDRRMNKLTLCDVYLREDGEIKKVDNHIHVFSVMDKELEYITQMDCIYFSAIPTRYKKYDDDNTIYNYTLINLSDILIMEVR